MESFIEETQTQRLRGDWNGTKFTVVETDLESYNMKDAWASCSYCGFIKKIEVEWA